MFISDRVVTTSEIERVHITLEIEREFAPGLVLCRTTGTRRKKWQKWGIYHKRSGLPLGFREKKTDAIAFGEAFAPLTDWTQPAGSLNISKEIREIAGRMQSRKGEPQCLTTFSQSCV